MDFASEWNGGHLGPRRFWKTCLPRLKYHNPAVSMTVNRTTDQAGPATMTIFFATTPNTSAAAASPSSSSVNERVEVIDMKNRPELETLQNLLEITKAVKVKPTEEEELELRQMQEEDVKSEQDREKSRVFREKFKAEQALLAQAKEIIKANAKA
ncbi:hypothetical protein MMC13_005227 [Lambiella insularis]|nr:hypothetical protein [Lambiella insularis]